MCCGLLAKKCKVKGYQEVKLTYDDTGPIIPEYDGNNESIVLFSSLCCHGQFIFVVIKIISKKGREKPVLLQSGQSDHITYELCSSKFIPQRQSNTSRWIVFDYVPLQNYRTQFHWVQFVRLSSIGSEIELTEESVFDFVRLPNSIELNPRIMPGLI